MNAAINEEIKRINGSLQEWERISRSRLVAEEWSPASGELSASLKLKRKVVAQRYEDLLSSIYQKKV